MSGLSVLMYLLSSIYEAVTLFAGGNTASTSGAVPSGPCGDHEDTGPDLPGGDSS